MKITNYMINKWSKAALLIIFGTIFLYYIEPVNAEIRALLSIFPIPIDMTGLLDLGYVIYLIIALWCFVDAALNILTSFREGKLSLDDLGAKIDMIEKKLASAQQPIQPQQPEQFPQKPIVIEQESVAIAEPQAPAPTPAPPTDVPPPP